LADEFGQVHRVRVENRDRLWFLFSCQSRPIDLSQPALLIDLDLQLNPVSSQASAALQHSNSPEPSTSHYDGSGVGQLDVACHWPRKLGAHSGRNGGVKIAPGAPLGPFQCGQKPILHNVKTRLSPREKTF